jgi:hypothetical protein
VTKALPNKFTRRKRPRAKSPSKNKINRAARDERHLFSVYAGQSWLGNVEQRGDAFTARTIRGRKIGVYATLKVAADAVSGAEAA